MAKARITSNNGDGLYGIELEFDSTDLDSQIAALAQQLIDIEQQVLDARVAVIEAEDVRDSLANDLDLAIDAYAAGGESAPVIAATTALAESAAQLNAARFRLQRISGQKLSLAARKTQLENTIVDSQASASDLVWCADYSTDLTAGAMVPVATPPGEITGAPWVILPQQHPDGYGGAYSRAAHGQLVPRLSMSPAATFYNWAVLPGWQRWMPTHRIGTLTFVDQDNDTCTVALDTARSSADPWPYTQGLNVNLSESTATMLEGVPIRYMTCNAAVFEAGDRVLVRFAQPSKATAGPGAWDGAEVIGFVSEPRACDIFYAAVFESVSGEYVDDFDSSQTCFIGPTGSEVCTNIWTWTQSMTLSEPFAYSEEEDGMLTVDYSWLYVQDAERDMETAPDFADWVYTRDWNMTASCTITVGGQSITLLSMTGNQDITDRSAGGLKDYPQAKSVSHSLVTRLITKSTADAKIWFGLVEKSDVNYSDGTGIHIRSRYEVISVDGIEYITDDITVGGNTPLDLPLEDTSNSTYCLFESGLLDIESPESADLVVESGNLISNLLTAPRRPSFFSEVSLTDSQKSFLRQARNGELPVLSL